MPMAKTCRAGFPEVTPLPTTGRTTVDTVATNQVVATAAYINAPTGQYAHTGSVYYAAVPLQAGQDCRGGGPAGDWHLARARAERLRHDRRLNHAVSCGQTPWLPRAAVRARRGCRGPRFALAVAAPVQIS
jgi:hypothetical protein